jgi:hypothetical protein
MGEGSFYRGAWLIGSEPHLIDFRCEVGVIPGDKAVTTVNLSWSVFNPSLLSASQYWSFP